MENEDPVPLIDELLEAMNAHGMDRKSVQAPSRPDSPNTVPLVTDVLKRSKLPLKNGGLLVLQATVEPSQTASHRSMSKREHALRELLSSERAYASDLALMRQVHLPLAQGQSIPFVGPLSPPNSSGSSSRTLSTASDSSTASLGPPMSQADADVIFINIAELLSLAEQLCQELEGALGSILDGGQGEDHVGRVFYDFIPRLERPYQYYITKHPTALQRLQSLPSTPALQNYLAYTRTVASSVSHAWDLASLLIKPVQRLLKYPLLLQAIIDDTPDSHPDKQNLKEAKQRTEEIARNVNEVRRRSEVVKEILTSKKKSINVAVTASVNLGKMKNLRPGSMKSLQNDANGEASQVEGYSAQMKAIEDFANDLAKNIIEWARSMTKVMAALKIWAIGFGKVIGLSEEQRSEAFEAFVQVIEEQLKKLADLLEQDVNILLLRHMARLTDTLVQPKKLLASMREQEPFHYHLLTMNVSKNRPPAALLAASTNYLALRGQLATDLPRYVGLLRTGLDICIAKLAETQTSFWGSVRDTWAELWDMLRVEGELNAGCEETMNVWSARWMDVDDVVSHLNINQRKKLYQEPERARPSSHQPDRARGSSHNLHSMLGSLEPEHLQPKRPGYSSSRHGSIDRSDSSSLSSGFVTIPTPSHPMPQRQRSLSRRDTDENRKDRGKSPRRKSDRDGYSQRVQYPSPYDQTGESSGAIPRHRSMPLDHQGLSRDPSRRATSPPRIYAVHDDDHGAQIYYPYSAPVENFDLRQTREYERPTMSRDDSYRKPTKSEASKPSKKSSGRTRSGSVSSLFKSEKQTREAPPVPTQQMDTGMFSRNRRDSLVNKPARYVTQVIAPCMFKRGIDYYGFPFFDLFNGEFYEVLQEAGHPSIHKLPVYVDEGEEDCLLLCRDRDGLVGWAFASFMEPVDMPPRR